jgi:YcxB-like protein
MNSQAMADGDTAAELNQSRNASESEAVAIVRAQVVEFRRRLSALRGYRAVATTLCLALPVLVAMLLIADLLHWIPRISSLVVAAAAGFLTFGLCRIWSRYYLGACGKLYRDCYRANRRFCLEQDALVICEPSGVTSRVPWSAVLNVISRDDLLMIYLTPADSISLPKAAFEGQDVDAFGAELVCRWQSSRGARADGVP